jgi:hypothetical protein
MIFNDLTGQTFGEYTVVNRAPNRGKGHITRWNCRCSCGTLNEQDGYALRKGKTTRCKNCSTSRYKWQGYEDISKTYWSGIKARALLRNKKFEVTIEEAWDLFVKQNKSCALSGLPLIFSRRYITNLCKDQTASLDRIDSSKGYLPGNVQWVHKDINRMKQDLDQPRFLDLCLKITNFARKDE